MSPGQHLDSDILECLRDVIDPEVGISIVDLGLVYAATQRSLLVEVAVTLTTRACPLGATMIENIRTILSQRFPDAALDVRLVWAPPWNPDRITRRGRILLGRQPEDVDHVPV